MGLDSQLTDISSGSLPICLLAIIAHGVSYLRSLIFTFLHSFGIPYQSDDSNGSNDTVLFNTIGSGLARIILLADQMNWNRVLSYKYSLCGEGVDHVCCECVVCLNVIEDGDHVRKLDCQHVFHKECFDGWLEQVKFTCPVCRAPVVCDERVELTRRRVAEEVLDWFCFR